MRRDGPRVFWLLLLLGLLGCSNAAPTENQKPRVCSIDADCGKGRYCSEAGICRSDCTIDAHCYGPATNAQCNAQGRCIETIDAASPPPEADAAKPGSEVGG